MSSLSRTTPNLTVNFELIFNAIPDLVFWKDRNSIIRGCNKAFLKFLNVDDASFIIGKTIPEFINPIDSIVLESDDFEVMATGNAKHDQIEIESLNGEKRWFDLKKSSILSHDQEPIGLLTIMSDITALKNSEQAKQKAIYDLKQSNEQLRYVKQRLLYAQENERKKLASELHDDLGQQMTLLKYALHSEEVSPEILQAVQESIDKIRSLSRNISPIYLNNNPLGILIDQHIEKLNKFIKSMSFEALFEFEESTIQGKQKLHVFRIIQEVTNNVAKHSKGTHCRINLIENSNEIHLVFEDDGEAYDFEQSLRKSNSFGLLTIKERVQSLNGTIDYHSKRNEGIYNKLVIQIPKLLVH